MPGKTQPTALPVSETASKTSTEGKAICRMNEQMQESFRIFITEKGRHPAAILTAILLKQQSIQIKQDGRARSISMPATLIQSQDQVLMRYKKKLFEDK